MSRAKPESERTGNEWRPAPVEAPIVDAEWVTPAPPETLDAAGVQLWEDVWSLGGPDGVYHAVADYGLVKRYVDLTQRRERMLTLLDAEGYTVIGSQGQDVQHPAARILSDVEGRLIPVEDRLGLSPQARHTIMIGRAKAVKSAFEEWNEED